MADLHLLRLGLSIIAAWRDPGPRAPAGAPVVTRRPSTWQVSDGLDRERVAVLAEVAHQDEEVGAEAEQGPAGRPRRLLSNSSASRMLSQRVSRTVTLRSPRRSAGRCRPRSPWRRGWSTAWGGGPRSSRSERHPGEHGEPSSPMEPVTTGTSPGRGSSRGREATAGRARRAPAPVLLGVQDLGRRVGRVGVGLLDVLDADAVEEPLPGLAAEQEGEAEGVGQEQLHLDEGRRSPDGLRARLVGLGRLLLRLPDASLRLSMERVATMADPSMTARIATAWSSVVARF